MTTPARKQKNAGGGGGEGSPNGRKTEAAPVAESVKPPASKEARTPDAAETEESALPQVKAVPASPKVYIRKVKGKTKKS